MGVGEAGPGGGDADVAGQRQLETAGNRHAIDGADDRLMAQFDGQNRVLVGRGGVGAAQGGGLAAQFLQVEPGGEGPLASAGEDDGANGRIRVDRDHHARKLCAQGDGQGVHRLRSIERDNGDSALALKQN